MSDFLIWPKQGDPRNNNNNTTEDANKDLTFLVHQDILEYCF